MATRKPFAPVACVVGFHHARGPEIEKWYGVEDGSDPAVENDWSFLPFMALSDGAHASIEDFSYFTLRQQGTPERPPISLFGISCTRQLDANELIIRPDDVTRSTVQKALVVIMDSPQSFGQIREKLSIVTQAWFEQRNFTDEDILKKFQESLVRNVATEEDDKDQYLGLSLRELIHEFKYQTLVLFKCCLLQPKMLFFGSRCERLCMMQFSLISLIPGLIRRLEDCADPELDSYEKSLVMPTSLKTSERSSLLAYMGLPLQIFGKGSLFGPYTPLQQLDTLADYGTKSYIVGSTNALLLQQRDRYSDILINLDDSTISITSSSLRNALNLSAADRRWIDFLTATVSDSWDESNPSRPKTMGYMGSEEFIRLQFEEYLLALLSSVKYHMHLHPHSAHRSPTEPDIDPVLDFNIDWVDAWQQTASFSLFNRFTDSNIFDIVEPKHPTAGGLSIDDINRRIAQQIQELHLDERLATSREALNKHLVTGQKKVSTAFNNLWADIEAMREAQRKRAEESRAAMTASTGALPSPSPASPPSSKIGRGGFFDGGKNSSSTDLSSPRPRFDTTALRARAPDLSQAQASVQAVGQKAGAYLSSWGSWASERRKGWGAQKPGSGTSVSTFMGEGKGPGPGTSEIGERGSGMNPGVETDRGTRIDLKGREKEEDKDERSGGSAAGGRPISPRKTKSFAKSAREERGGDGIGRLDA